MAYNSINNRLVSMQSELDRARILYNQFSHMTNPFKLDLIDCLSEKTLVQYINKWKIRWSRLTFWIRKNWRSHRMIKINKKWMKKTSKKGRKMQSSPVKAIWDSSKIYGMVQEEPLFQYILGANDFVNYYCKMIY